MDNIKCKMRDYTIKMQQKINKLGDLINKLTIINLKIWFHESKLNEIKSMKNPNLKRVGEVAIAIRNLNNQRIAIKQELNK